MKPIGQQWKAAGIYDGAFHSDPGIVVKLCFSNPQEVLVDSFSESEIIFVHEEERKIIDRCIQPNSCDDFISLYL